MHRAISVLLLLICCQYAGTTLAQGIGLLPSGVKWFQLRHDSLRVVYPEGQEQTARRVASLMLKLASADPIVTNGRYKPISVLLQPQTTISNGYVGLAPYVSEFYLEPHENPFVLGSLPWADLLALHEYRHVQQVNAAKNGITNVLRIIFGDLVFSGLYNLSVPDWYREGDAVFAESKWSLQGRGRLSQFTLPFYLKAVEGHIWDYYKVRNGSFKEFTPDIYALGYMMIQYGNQSFSESVWDTIMHESPRYKNLIRPFSKRVKEKYGKYSKGLYRDAMECYQDECGMIKSYDMAYPRVRAAEKDEKADYLDMSFPVVDGDGSIYVAVKSFDHISGIYRIDQQGERKKVISLGLQKDPFFHYSNDRFVWTEYRNDPRWLRKDKNVIVVFDKKSGNKKSFIPDKGFFTPSLNARGDRIVALHTDKEGKYNLQILDASSGEIIQELPNAENLYLGYPTFAEDEKSIIATARNHEGRMCLVEQELASGNFRYITHYSYAVLGRPVVRGPWIYVTTGMEMLDQVFAVDKEEGIFYQVSDGNTAHYDPAWDPVQDGLVCAEYRLTGKKLIRLSGAPRDWRMINLHPGIKELQGFSGRNLLAENDRTDGFQVQKYSRWADAINPHSWVVTADDPLWGIEVKSDNILNTVTMAGGYRYDRNTKAKGPYVEATFGMWYPLISIGVSRISREVKDEVGNEYSLGLNEISGGLSLPLQFTAGPYQQTVYASSTFNGGYRRLTPTLPNNDVTYNYGQHQVVLINSRRMAYRQSMPTWGQRFDFSYSHDWSGIPIYQFYMGLELALPALAPSHYLSIRGERLKQDNNGAVLLSSPYRGPRGFPYVEYKSQHRLGITYGFPLWYPDRGLGNIFYTKRIRLQPFFDYATTDYPLAPDGDMKSAGAELIIDFDFPPITLGFRYSRLLSGYEGSPNQIEFFIPSQRF